MNLDKVLPSSYFTFIRENCTNLTVTWSGDELMMLESRCRLVMRSVYIHIIDGAFSSAN